ncbi:ExeA family protein [Novipirellula artificiosorum]|uniref:AAA+ ATPase domain-containing protein n=1 Tax=Novipirellula artificiosorum TaxID=2528016 RepID=A0A5C6DA79_9BACT|nr:AAA family ATPase [Novipirellula artificiosorum]TWU33800.1 hypothetical protein Poly41_47980 [Novipirellula artificiosorum]
MRPSNPQYVVPPFPAFPSVTRYVPIGSIADAVDRVCRSVDAREGLSLVIGPPGTGKSLLCSLLVDRYQESHDCVVLGETPIENRAGYLRHMLHHLGADYRNVDESDLQLALVDRVCDQASDREGLLIIVDEAQALAPEVLEAIRMSTNIHRQGEPRVCAVVVGGVKLDDTLAEPTLEPFTQRISARCYLHPMNGEETRHYISETIQSCGADPENTITREAISMVHHACCGVPRLVNQVMTEAIDIAEESDESLITEQSIDRAWAQLQQLPSPMLESPKLNASSNSIEFGELDELGGLDERNGLDERDRDEAVAESDVDPLDLKQDPMQEEPEEANLETLAFDEEELMDAASAVNAIARENWLSAEIVAGDEATLYEEPDGRGPVTVPAAIGSPPKTASTQAIFGDFEDEEDVCLGSGVIPFARGTSATGTKNSDPTVDNSRHDLPAENPSTESSDPCRDRDLETILHQEIVGISDMAAASELYAMHDAATPHSCSSDCANCECHDRTLDHHVIEGSDDSEETSDIVAIQLHQSSEDAGAVDEPLESDEALTGILLRDDSDLLIIEEDLDLAGESKSTSNDESEQKVSVDFQAMLQRMRTGTEG